MRNFLHTALVSHKILTAFIAMGVIGGAYWGYGYLTSSTGETRYVTFLVERGTVVSSVTGTGQVSASNQVDLKAKVSGDVVVVSVVNGQETKGGALAFQLDARDALKAVRDAEVNLASAKLSLEKIQKPADILSVTQAENTVARAKESKQNAEADLISSYETGFNNVSNAFLDLPAIMAGLQDMLYSSSPSFGGSGQTNLDYYTGAAAQFDEKANQLKTDTDKKYQDARRAYDQAFLAYKSTSRSSENSVIESVIVGTYNTTRSIAEAIKSSNNLIQFYKDKLIEHGLKPASLADTHLASLNTYTGKTNSHLTSLLGSQSTIKSDREAIVNAERTIVENSEALIKLKAGADILDLKSAEISVQQRQNSLQDAREKLSDYYVRIPFDGTIAKVNVKRLDPVSSSAVLAILISKQKLAEISLNEVDAAKIKAGQKATLTFDAIDGLTIAGQVVEIDSIGTVSQGVVTYAVKVAFDTQDDRIKPGMSVSAGIITDIRQDVLMVPNSAVRTQGEAYYVEVFDLGIPEGEDGQGAVSLVPPRQQVVKPGISNDTATEILEGLKEGDTVVLRTISGTTATTQQAPSLLGAIGGNRGGGGTRIPGATGR